MAGAVINKVCKNLKITAKLIASFAQVKGMYKRQSSMKHICDVCVKVQNLLSASRAMYVYMAALDAYAELLN